MIKKDQTENKKRKTSRFKTIFSISMLVVGVVALVGFLALMQNYSAERNQEKSSKLILAEVETTLRKNDEIYNSVFHEFNEINQSTLGALSQYATYIDILGPISNAAATNDPNLDNIVNDTVSDLKDICNNLNLREVFIVKDDGEIQIGSNFQYINENLNDMFSEEQMSQLIGYETSAAGEVIRSGTVRYVDGDEEFSPILVEYDGSDTSFYLYSTYFGSKAGSDYYLLTYAPSSLIEDELRGIKNISSVLSGITVGKSGFLFAVDANEGVFTYFDDGKTSLTGQSYSSKGLKQEAAKDDYTGYQTINGIKYFCVTRQFDFDAYGKYTVVAAVVSQDEIISNNILTICFSSLAFVLVAAIVSGYGLILRRDIADHILGLEDKFKSNLKDETVTKKIAFTDEEIEERTKILLDETIAKNKDRKLKRKNLGVRNAKGQQRYFSTYIFGKLASVIAVGLVAIFGISFFSQTLLGLNDATSVSTNRLNEIIETITKNDENSERIQGYVDDQFLSKARLVSYLLEETPEIVFENNPESCEHRVFEKDDNGNNVYLDYDAYPGNPRIAWSNSPALIEFCKNIGVDSIYLYSDDGKCLATSTDYWYFSISKDPNDQSYPFNDILDDKTNYYIQDVMIGEITGKYDKFIGSEYYYYTYDDAGEVAFAKRTDYEDYKAGTWVGSPITRHRSLLQIGVSEASFKALFETSTISYILSNMAIYGENSFFVAFDKSDEHKVVYAPYEDLIGKTAASLGVLDSAFTITGTYNGFQSLDGTKFYQSIEVVGDYYIATAIPTSNIYETRNSISAYTLLFSTLFIVLASAAFTISSDRDDKEYCKAIKKNNEYDESSSFIIQTPSGRSKKTTSVVSRFSKVVWRKKSPEEKLTTILMAYMTVATVSIAALIIWALNDPSNHTIFQYIFSDVWERGFNVFAITQALMIMIIIITVTQLAQICVRSFCGNLGARVETTGNLIVSVLKYGGVIGGVFYCLYLFGFNTASLLTSAGILSIVVGLGAQSLISDIIAGIFIVFEGSFRVGDIVTIGDFRGQVLEIGLRTTKIEDVANNIKIFNNSSISGVLNMTKEASYAKIVVSIEYGEDLEKVERIIQEAFPKIRRKLPTIIDGPFYKGIAELGESSVDLIITAQCAEKDRMQLARDLNREIFLLFGRNNINIPFPQVTLSYLDKQGEEKTVTVDEEGK